MPKCSDFVGNCQFGRNFISQIFDLYDPIVSAQSKLRYFEKKKALADCKGFVGGRSGI
jgi:hypothetical protein